MIRLRPIFDSSVVATVELAVGHAVALHALEVQNPNGSDGWLQLFDAAAAADVTIGTTAPKQSYLIPNNGANDKAFGDNPIGFELGLCYAVTTTATGLTALGTGCVLNLAVSGG